MWRLLNGKWFFAPENEGGAEPADDAGDELADDAGDEPADDAGDEPADDAGDEPADDAGDEPADDAGDEPAVSRKETRTQRLANEARREREGRIAAEAEARALRESRQTPQDNGEAARVRAEKLALLDPTERKVFEQDEIIRRLEQGQQLTQLQIADYSDKATYETKAASNPVYARHKDWVENTLVAERKAGRNPSRELLLRIKIGDEALRAKPKVKAGKERDAAAARVKAVQGAPISGRSDAGGKKTGKGDSLEDLTARLRDVQL